MEKPLDVLHLRQIQAAYEAGFGRCLVLLGEIKPYMSLNEANKVYGSGIVKKWIDAGLVTLVRDGRNTSKYRIERAEIALIASMNNPECLPDDDDTNTEG